MMFFAPNVSAFLWTLLTAALLLFAGVVLLWHPVEGTARRPLAPARIASDRSARAVRSKSSGLEKYSNYRGLAAALSRRAAAAGSNEKVQASA